MLNLGQVVYDMTNKRVLIFGGIEMFQDQKSGACHTVSNFLTEDMEELRFGEDEQPPFKYRNWPQDQETKAIPIGSFASDANLMGCYFGNVDFKKALEDEELVESIKKTFKAAKTWDPPKED